MEILVTLLTTNGNLNPINQLQSQPSYKGNNGMLFPPPLHVCGLALEKNLPDQVNGLNPTVSIGVNEVLWKRGIIYLLRLAGLFAPPHSQATCLRGGGWGGRGRMGRGWRGEGGGG